jgi:membrane-bound serine protease (ClpP class)
MRTLPCRLCAAWLAGRLLAACWMLVAGSAFGAAPVRVLQVQDAIGPASADYVVRGLAKARDAGAPLVVIELDTPGGLDSSMRQIIQAILASPVPVAVWVSPEGARAASAGTYILYAAHVAAMAPATTLGAATPVAIGMPTPGGGAPGRKPLPGPASGAPAPEGADQGAAPLDAMTAKQVHDAAAFIRGLAQQRGRNAEWAERAVREAVTLTATEAQQQKVVDVVATDLADLLAKIDGKRVGVSTGELTLQTRGLATETVAPDWRHRVLAVIANPSFALILMMIGIYGLLFEFSTPGFGVAGVAGAICLLLALFALQLLPINYAGLALLLLGIGLLVAEVFTPSFGILGVGGVIAFVAGGLLLFDSDVPGFGVPLGLVIALAASSALVVGVGGSLAMRARKRPVVSGREEMAGAVGEVFAVEADGAWALVRGERWRVRCGSPLVPGARVRVQRLDGLVLDVEPDFPPQGAS